MTTPISDFEGHTFTIKILKSDLTLPPAWFIFPSGSTAWNEYGVDTVAAGLLSLQMVIQLCDELNACGLTYPWTLNIVNTISFTCTPNLISTSVVYAPLSLTTDYSFECTCSDGSSVTLTLNEEFYPSVPGWVRYDTTLKKFVLTPAVASLVGGRYIEYKPCNPNNVCGSVTKFLLSVTNDYPKFVPAIASLPNK